MNHETHKILETGKMLYKDEVFLIQGAVFEVYHEMGCGFLENVYQECMEIEFIHRKIPFDAQKELQLMYKDKPLRRTYKPDLICYNKIIIELKEAKETLPEHKAQIFNYLKATGLRLGLLVNFGHYPKATVKRIIL